MGKRVTQLGILSHQTIFLKSMEMCLNNNNNNKIIENLLMLADHF
jgi:hypothetical protein